MDTWLEVLRQAVASSSLAVMAERLGISRTTISQVCNEKYPGDLVRIQGLVESVLMGHTVECPILGRIPQHQCQAHQRRKAGDVGSTPNEIRLYKACRSGCPHSQLGEEELLRRPMRLPVKTIDSEPVAVAQYDADAVLGRLRRQARTDGGDNLSRQNLALLALLEEEIKILGIRFNRLLVKAGKNNQ
ncbi:transcriptional regulator [Aeromonas sp. MR16]|uniref:transcriptional regulator n=1 Tax=Aeromonas sp. MR16 TaxID=2923420 RepID=UPI001F4A0E1F|nr:transcriptional regulator [Aeromonas sp. MR16]MCH7371057.1 transcriptional regulator [Aeromonas sp. MR16]